MPKSTAQPNTLKVEVIGDWVEEGLSEGTITVRTGRVRVGQIIYVRYKKKHYLVKLLGRAKTGHFLVRSATGDEWRLLPDGHKCVVMGYAVIKRKKPSKADSRATQIRDLQSRLNRLEDEDDYHTPGQRLRLEKRIYDLERDIQRDEWPEVVGA